MVTGIISNMARCARLGRSALPLMLTAGIMLALLVGILFLAEPAAAILPEPGTAAIGAAPQQAAGSLGNPTNLQAAPAGGGQVRLTWQPASNADVHWIGWYKIESDGTETLVDILKVARTASSVTITGLDNGQRYSFAIFASREVAGEFQSSQQSDRAPATPNGTSPPGEDYDADNDGLIEISNLPQLDAIRYDLDGDGATDDGNPAYAAVFPGAVAAMGCPSSGCAGYELNANLDAEPTEIWTPIGSDNARFTAIFHGNGHTISKT